MFARIVVPLDGSEFAEQALPVAEDLARRTGAPLHLVRVVDVTRLDRYGPYAVAVSATAFGRVLAEEEAAAQAYLASIVTDLASGGVAATVETRRGPAARELAAFAQPGDLMVMATHGRSGPTRWLLGSVAEEVARRATVPVMLVRSHPSARSYQSTRTGQPATNDVSWGNRP